MDKEIWVGRKPNVVGHSGTLIKFLNGELGRFELLNMKFGNSYRQGYEHGLKGMALTMTLGTLRSGFVNVSFYTLDTGILPSLKSEGETMMWIFQHMEPQDIMWLVNIIYNNGIDKGICELQNKLKGLLEIK